MSKKTSEKELIESVANEARESFDLGDMLRKRNQRTKTIRVFTDEALAERRGGFETGFATNEYGGKVPTFRSWGVVKELAEAENEYENLESKKTAEARALKSKVESLTAELKDLTAKLVATSLSIELRSIPSIIRKDAHRAAKKYLGVNGQVPEGRLEEWADENAAQLLVRCVVSITKEETGETNEGVSIETARIMRGHLPDSEWDKIDTALSELLFEKVIADEVVSDTDF